MHRICRQGEEQAALAEKAAGNLFAARGLDLIALSASSGARARRIREMEVLEAEGRILRAQAKARAFSLTSLQELPGRVLSTGSLQV